MRLRKASLRRQMAAALRRRWISRRRGYSQILHLRAEGRLRDVRLLGRAREVLHPPVYDEAFHLLDAWQIYHKSLSIYPPAVFNAAGKSNPHKHRLSKILTIPPQQSCLHFATCRAWRMSAKEAIASLTASVVFGPKGAGSHHVDLWLAFKSMDLTGAGKIKPFGLPTSPLHLLLYWMEPPNKRECPS